jgi:hypothetical protein
MCALQKKMSAEERSLQSQTHELPDAEEKIGQEAALADARAAALSRRQMKLAAVIEKRDLLEQQKRAVGDRLLKKIRKLETKLDIERAQLDDERSQYEALLRTNDELAVRCEALGRRLIEEEKREEILQEWDHRLSRREQKVARGESNISLLEIELRGLHQEILEKHANQSAFEAGVILELNTPVEPVLIPEFTPLQAELISLKSTNQQLWNEYEKEATAMNRSQTALSESQKAMADLLKETEVTERQVLDAREKRAQSRAKHSLGLESKRLWAHIALRRYQVSCRRRRIIVKTRRLQRIATSLDITSCGTDAVVVPKPSITKSESKRFAGIVSHFRQFHSVVTAAVQPFRDGAAEVHESTFQTWIEFLDQETLALAHWAPYRHPSTCVFPASAAVSMPEP